MLDKSVEDLTGKLAAEAAKRKELENRVKQLASESPSTKTENKSEDKPASVSSAVMRVCFRNSEDKCRKMPENYFINKGILV